MKLHQKFVGPDLSKSRKGGALIFLFLCLFVFIAMMIVGGKFIGPIPARPAGFVFFIFDLFGMWCVIASIADD